MTGIGGHVGFVEGIIPKSQWFPKPSLEFLKNFK
jgi:predicted alpha/beta-fold hydrolase